MTNEQKDMLAGMNFDVSGTLSRFMNKENLYERFLIKFLDDVNYNGLIKSIEEKNYEGAYISAHTLKGVAGNLGITGIYECSIELLEKLKAKEYEGIDDILNQLTESYNAAYEAISTLK